MTKRAEEIEEPLLCSREIIYSFVYLYLVAKRLCGKLLEY